MFIIPVGATTITIRETVATRNYLGDFIEDKDILSSLSIFLCGPSVFVCLTVTSVLGQLSRTSVVSTTSMVTG